MRIKFSSQCKRSGKFRSSQNWIGGVSIDDAIFVPSSHTIMKELNEGFCSETYEY